MLQQLLINKIGGEQTKSNYFVGVPILNITITAKQKSQESRIKLTLPAIETIIFFFKDTHLFDNQT